MSPVVAGTLLLFSTIAGTKIRLMGQGGLWTVTLSPVSQLLSVPLILGGILAGFVSAYVFIASEGLVYGLMYWFGIGLVMAYLIDLILRFGLDALVSVLGVFCLTTGGWLFVTESL